MFQAFGRRWGRNLSIGRFLIACMVIGIASLLAAGIAAAWSNQRSQAHTEAVNHTYQVKLAIAEVGRLVEEGGTARRGYILSPSPEYVETFRRVSQQLPGAVNSLAALTADNPRQQSNIVKLRGMIDALQQQRDRTNALVANGQIEDAIRIFREESASAKMETIRALGESMQREEQRLLVLRENQQRASVHIFYVTLLVAGALLIFVAISSLLTILRYTRDLTASHEKLRDFADSLEELVADRTTDLSRANDEIQRFAYIVSHDLRSPLVNVMGFTAELEAATVAITDLIDRAEQTAPEIVTEDARNAARDDLPEAIGFIRTSTQKMDRLIGAILKLSREGRRVLTHEAVNVTELVGTIGATLKHVMDARDVRLVVEGELPSIVSDRLALEQIFSNLMENAVKYLKPGEPGLVTIRGRREGSRVGYEIEDNGRGIDPRDHQRVFDLFRRSGNQDQPGEGIGLAHVRALAYRLGGIIDVQSELGKGAIFRLSLPATLTES